MSGAASCQGQLVAVKQEGEWLRGRLGQEGGLVNRRLWVQVRECYSTARLSGFNTVRLTLRFT